MKYIKDCSIYILISIGLITIYGCGKPTEIMKAEFKSMDSCLASIKKSSGGNLNIITDKLGKISGKLSNEEHFTCETKSSGTKGVYVEGWYTISK
jgi:hypothetical protein